MIFAAIRRLFEKPKYVRAIPREIDLLYVDATQADEDDEEGAFLGNDGLYDDYNGPSRAVDFGLPAELQSRFRKWSRSFLELEDRQYAGKTVDFSDCNSEGFALAKEVKGHYPAREVMYYDLLEDKYIPITL